MLRGIYRMTPRRLRKAIDAGVFGENHVELLGGVPFIMSGNPPPIVAAAPVHAERSPLAPLPRWFVNREHRPAHGRWRPLADGIVLRGPRSTYTTRLSRGDDVVLLVEVSDTSYARDSGPKPRPYAAYRIPV